MPWPLVPFQCFILILIPRDLGRDEQPGGSTESAEVMRVKTRYIMVGGLRAILALWGVGVWGCRCRLQHGCNT